MAKFSKKTNATPQISTASLPDIVFMLLFFFMVTTTLRETDLKVDIKLPKATQLQKLERKSLVSYIYVGKPKQKELFGTEPRIQVNDVFMTPKEVPQFVEQERSKLAEIERPHIVISLRVDTDTKMGILNDVKLALRDADARQINYASVKGEK